MKSVLLAVLRFRLLVIGVAAGLLVLGVISLRQMHSDVLPELASGPVLEVQTEALGLSSEEVEQYITVPLENNLLDGVMGVWDTRAHSVPGLSAVDLYFQPGTSVAHARLLVQERLTRAFSLPNVSRPPLLIQPISSTGRVMMIGLSSRSIDPLQLSYLARWIVRPRLSGVSGVANVAIFHQQDRQIEVGVDPARLAAAHIKLEQVIRTTGNGQLVTPLSYLEGSAPGTGGFLDQPNQRLDIRPVLPLGTPKDLASLPISGAPGRKPLGSVTTAVENHQPLIGDAVVGGGSGLVLMVQKLPSASVVGVTKGLERALADLRPALRGVRIDSSLYRPATYVSNSLHNQAIGLIIAAALVLLALIALLLEARVALVGFVGVALSMLVATAVLQALGYTFNALVALGLLLASAVVVDDAVQTTQQIVRRLRERGEAGHELALQQRIADACGHLRGTLGYATLVVLLSVAPVFFAKGVTATFVHPMVLAFALAVTASMVVALTFIPAAGMLLFDRGRPRPHEVRAIRRTVLAYQSLVRRALAIPRVAVLLVCLLGTAGVVSLAFVGSPAAPTFKDRSLVVEWNGPPGASLTEMKRVTERVVRELRSLPVVLDAGATLGRAVSADQLVDANSGQLLVTIKPDAGYQQAISLVRRVVERTPGIRAGVGTGETDAASDVLVPASREVVVRVYGERYDVLRRLANRVSRLMHDAGGLGDTQLQTPTLAPNIEVKVNDAAALRAGVLPGDARRAASTLVSGLTVGNFFENQAVFDVVVHGEPSVRRNLGSMRRMLIDTSGGHVRLGDIARLRVRSNPIDIQHEASSRYVDLTAPVTNGSVDSARAALQKKLRQIRFPLEYHAETLGATPADPTSHGAFLAYGLAAAIGIFLLLQAAFSSWRLAALLLVTLPLALLGALAVALATGEQNSLGAVAGLVAVFAFAARQGMLLITRLRDIHEREGGPMTAAIVVRAAGERFTASTAAAVTVALVLLPFVVLGDVAGNEMAHTAAAVMLGGLVTSTLLTLLVLPAACLVLGPAAPVPAPEPESTFGVGSPDAAVVEPESTVRERTPDLTPS